MPWGGRGWFGGGFGRGFGYLVTGLPGWARGWPRGGYCWYYYVQTGQFPPWSPWNWYLGNQSQSSIQSQDQANLEYLEAMKASLEEQLKTLENQIKELKKKLGEKK